MSYEPVEALSLSETPPFVTPPPDWTGDNGRVPDEKEWSKLRSALYALISRDPASNRLIVDLAGLSAGDHTLDIGCGPGAAVRHAGRVVTRGKAVGVDRSQAMVETARRRSVGLENVHFEVGPAEALPFADGSFNAVWTVHAFHHWEDPSTGIAESRRVLAPGGRFLIVERESSRAHGLSPAEADDLTYSLLQSGFAEASVTKHKKELVVMAIAPE